MRSRARAKGKKVTVAGLRSCGHCQNTMAFLRQNKVPFKFHEVSTPAGAKLADSVRAKHVPVIQVCGDMAGSKKKDSCKTTIGFKPGWLKRQLGI